MHRIGLHGKSFIPLIMGFGCNVPAIMATRTIESRSSRLITVLLVPFMSCSARIPIYILLIGTFFAAYASWVMLGLYLLGIVVLSSRPADAPLSVQEGRNAVRHGAAALSYADVQGHLPPYVGEGSAVSPQDGRYHYGGIHRYLGHWDIIPTTMNMKV